MENIDIDLYKILKSADSRNIVEILKYLYDADVLSSLEIKLCDEILEHLELVGMYDIYSILKDKEYFTEDLRKERGYTHIQLQENIDRFILKRKNSGYELAITNAANEFENKKISKESINLFFGRYTDIIDIKKDKDYSEISDLFIGNNENKISSVNNNIDERLGGICGLTSIVGDTTEDKSLWALNIAYNAAINGKNVLYIVLNSFKEIFYRRLLVRHSCNLEKYNELIDEESIYDNMNNDYYKGVYKDLVKDCLSKLIVFDEKDFTIHSHFNLQRLIALAQKRFMNKYKSGIDLIVIDDFTYMKLEDKRRCITNKHIIANEYLRYLRNQSRNLLNTDKEIPIIITICASDSGEYARKNSGNFICSSVLEEVVALSDNILTIYNLPNFKLDVYRVQIIKAVSKRIMTKSEMIEVDKEHWYMNYENYNYYNSIGKKLLTKEKMLEIKDKEIDRLKNEINCLKQKVSNFEEDVTIEF